MAYPHYWSPISCRSSAGQGKFAGQRPTYYHCATPPTYRGDILLNSCVTDSHSHRSVTSVLRNDFINPESLKAAWHHCISSCQLHLGRILRSTFGSVHCDTVVHCNELIEYRPRPNKRSKSTAGTNSLNKMLICYCDAIGRISRQNDK